MWMAEDYDQPPTFLLIGGQYSRAAQLFEQAGKAYRQYLGAADPWALDCAYQAGRSEYLRRG